MVGFRLNLTGRGWAECVVSDGVMEATATASWLSDGIGQFVAAVQGLHLTSSSASCEFTEEPGYFFWEFWRSNGGVQIRLWWISAYAEGSDDWELRFNGCVDLIGFLSVVDKELDRNLAQWGRDGFKEQWGYHFPEKSHALLKEALRRRC